jgi:hypothetical protein
MEYILEDWLDIYSKNLYFLNQKSENTDLDYIILNNALNNKYSDIDYKEISI